MNRPVPKKKFIKVLKLRGLEFKRQTDNHQVWNTKAGDLPQPVTFRNSDKDIPAFHVRTSCENMGITVKEFEKLLSQV